MVDLYMKPLEDEKKFLPLVDTVISDEVQASPVLADELLERSFLQYVQKHFTSAAKHVLN